MTAVYKKAYANSNCSKSCVAVSFPASVLSTMGSIPYCQTITDYSCRNIEMRILFYKIHENCPKYCYIMEYTGKRTFLLETDNNTKYEKKWYYIFSSKEVQVQEEYLLCDITGFVGSIGGTLGLFIGFSFLDIIDMVLDYLKKVLRVKQNKRQHTEMQNGNNCIESANFLGSNDTVNPEILV